MPHGLPRIIDEHNLAHILGIRTKTLWYLVRSCALPTTDPRAAYRHFSIPKPVRHGVVKKRHIYVMKHRTEDMQHVLTNVLVKPIPTGPQVAAYESGKSTIEASAFCVNSKVLIKMDCKDFFPSIRRSWIRKFYERLGYTRPVASLIAQLFCTARTYTTKGKTITINFLPMGSIAAPFLANRIAEELIDKPIMEFIKEYNTKNNQDVRYVRYSDNLYFPCYTHMRRAESQELSDSLSGIVNAAGWGTHKIMQVPYFRKQKVLGLVVNEKTNIDSTEYKLYRAILYNCAMKDIRVELEKYEARTSKTFSSPEMFINHLAGKIAWFKRNLTAHRVAQFDTWLALAKQKSTFLSLATAIPPTSAATTEGKE
jgi:hypothetical protein